MLRTDKLHQFADTELADTKVVTYTHRPYIPLGCDQQGRHPEAAHAASEYDDDPQEPLTRTEARLVALVWIASAGLVVLLGAHVLALWGVL